MTAKKERLVCVILLGTSSARKLCSHPALTILAKWGNRGLGSQQPWWSFARVR